MATCGDPNCGKDDFVYEMKWTPEISDYFTMHMALLAKKGKFVPGSCMADCLFTVQAQLEHKFNVHFTWRHLTKKIAELDKRYKVFTWIITHPGVTYDAKDNVVYASQPLWDYLMKVQIVMFLFSVITNFLIVCTG